LNPGQVHRNSFDHPLICNPTPSIHPQSPQHPIWYPDIKRNRRSVHGNNVLPLEPWRRQASVADQSGRQASWCPWRQQGRPAAKRLVSRRRIEKKKGGERVAERRDDPATDRRQIETRNRIRGRGSADLCEKPLAWAIQCGELGFRRCHGNLGFALLEFFPSFLRG
jgi:hypothetical protein